jgi:hypothetical protein
MQSAEAVAEYKKRAKFGMLWRTIRWQLLGMAFWGTHRGLILIENDAGTVHLEVQSTKRAGVVLALASATD